MPQRQMVKVGALACQMGSYLQTLTTKVVSCEPAAAAPASPAGGGKKDKKAAKAEADASTASAPAAEPLFDVVFEDSVLFPEGGGQPSDAGWLNEDIPVSKVRRVGDTCVITTNKAFEPGQEVTMKVDWAKRVDQMQHHTAQHLVTAVMEKELSLPTESWAYSNPTCYIQVPSGKIDPADLRKVEDKCNEAIWAGTKVVRHVFPSREEVPPARSRGIPADVNGPIRLIEVEGIDTCTCCGTHVENLKELQLIKLLHTEPKGNTSKVHFVTGQRAINQFSQMYERERALMKDLGTHPENIIASSERRGKELAEATKSSKKLMAEVASLVSPLITEQALSSSNTSIVFTYLREDGDMDFLTTVANAIKEKEKALLLAAAAAPEETSNATPTKNFILACGSLKGGPGEGALYMWGPDIGPIAQKIVLPALEGKGGQSKTGFRAKCHMKGWKQLVKDLAKLTEAPKME